MTQKRKATRRKIKKTPFLGLFCLGALIAISLVATVYLIFLRPGTLHYQDKLPAPAAKQPPQEDNQPRNPPLPLAARQTTSPAAIPSETKPKVAIIIDDIGYRRKIAEEFINLDLNINFSILPHAPAGADLAQKASAAGRDILLHVPMEPTLSKWDPGPGALLVRMDKQEIQKTFAGDLQSVPMAIGVNNHMGSLFSENTIAMGIFLGEIRSRKLFFIDSLTSSKSVGYPLARQMAIKTGKRDVFIDNDQETAKIIDQLTLLVQLAITHGQAIGIGHPYPTTLQALAASQHLLTDRVSLVPIHEIVQ